MTQITRFEIIDHRPCPTCKGKARSKGGDRPCWACGGSGTLGREVILSPNSGDIAEISLQDDGRTLKVFLKEGD